ncbi:hypothetical protein Slin14017_G106750 [Septoria linicola]|nr:hypothetical protein Slin14017_G106750 [Septoria linicola]
MDSSGSNDSLTSFSLLRELPQVTASMDQGWTYSAIESWIEDTIQQFARKASQTTILSTLVQEDTALSAVCNSCMRIIMLVDPASAVEAVENLQLGADVHDIQTLVISMANCHRCSQGKLGLEGVTNTSFDNHSSSAPGVFLRRSMSKVTYISAGVGQTRILRSTEEEIMGAAGNELYVIDLDASNVEARLATQALSQLVEVGVS